MAKTDTETTTITSTDVSMLAAHCDCSYADACAYLCALDDEGREMVLRSLWRRFGGGGADG